MCTRSERNFKCLDCGVDTLEVPDYTLQDDLWREINPIWVGCLCMPCMRRRMDRDLVLEDFKLEYPINYHISQELIDRLNRRYRCHASI